MTFFRRLDGGDALRSSGNNPRASWNHSPSSSIRSTRPEDASNRIFDGFADIDGVFEGRKLERSAPVFAMGSCFAREIEANLIRAGGNVVSMDDRLNCPEFVDETGRIRTGFFHRFTPFAMLQEFQQAFGEAEGWTDETLIVRSGERVFDLNYMEISGTDMTLDAVMLRRRIGAELVRKVVEAEVVILTLGLTESWFHKPSGFHANKVPGPVVVRRKDDFELRAISFEETLYCLREIKALIERHRSTPFELVVTVSPVPLQKTFGADDLIVANVNSKSTLRAAVAAFCAEGGAHYFPSYEIVTCSAPDLAWRPDRIHVQPDMVRHVVSRFVSAYYAEGALNI